MLYSCHIVNVVDTFSGERVGHEKARKKVQTRAKKIYHKYEFEITNLMHSLGWLHEKFSVEKKDPYVSSRSGKGLFISTQKFSLFSFSFAFTCKAFPSLVGGHWWQKKTITFICCCYFYRKKARFPLHTSLFTFFSSFNLCRFNSIRVQRILCFIHFCHKNEPRHTFYSISRALPLCGKLD